MHCPACRHENPPHATFCLECGTRITLFCASCRAELPPSAKFCLECGARVAESGAPSASRFAAPDSYTPPHLAERILTSKAALEGERKQVTILFADLKGSMELLADRDPEAARSILDPVLELMMEAVHRYEGTVNQVMGDGIMALFGAPIAHEDHAVRACYAALRMQDLVRRHSDELRHAQGLGIQIRVGLNSGDVVVRSIGNDLRMDYTAVGQTTHLAARLEQMARPGAVFVSTETRRLAEGYVVVNALGPRPVKGLNAPIDVYELVEAATIRSRFHAVAARGLTRFVGRAAEVAQLTQALDQAWAGHGQIVAIVGEPGVGKSRLYWEFTQLHRSHGWRVIESSSVSYGKATSYLPVVELLRAYFDVQLGDETAKIREKVAGKLLSLDRHLESSLAPILWLLDVPVDDVVWQQLDPPQRRQRVLDSVKKLLLREAQVQPLMVVFEDLHWIDSETQAFLNAVVDLLPTARLLFLVNYRPEYQHNWSGKASYRQIRIDPLPASSADELLDALLGLGAELEPLKRFLVERTEGNPFFLEESVRALVESRLLTGERGAYRALNTPSVLERARQIPASARALLAARIDRLSPQDKRLLQAAAVIGMHVPLSLVNAVAETTESESREGLARLQASEFMYETRLFPVVEYTFKHVLTHEVAYGSLLQERRRMLHAQIVEAIEALYPDRLTDHVERLAHHAFRGEHWERAVRYLRQAGAKAFARSANQESVTYLEQALVALSHVPDRYEARERAIDIRLELRNSLITLGELERIIDHLGEAERLATALNDRRRLGWILTFMTNASYHSGQHDRAVESAQRALAIADGIDDVPLRGEANFRLGQAYQPLGDYRRAIAFLRSSMDLLPGQLSYERFGGSGVLSVFARTWLCWCLTEIGEFQQGIVHGEEALQIATVAEHPYTLAHAQSGIGLVCLRKGDIVAAMSVLERGLVLCRVADIPTLFPLIAAQLGLAHALLGRTREALVLLEEVVKRAASMKLKWGDSPWRVWLMEAYLLASQVEEASRLATHDLEICRQHRERGREAWTLRHLGDIASHRQERIGDAADIYYREAIALASELGMRPLVAHCHAGLAKLYWRTGKAEQAEEALAAATTMYRELGMAYWLEKLETELPKP